MMIHGSAGGLLNWTIMIIRAFLQVARVRPRRPGRTGAVTVTVSVLCQGLCRQAEPSFVGHRDSHGDSATDHRTTQAGNLKQPER